MRDLLLAAVPVLVGSALVFGPVAAWLARARHRPTAQWLLYGIVLGPVAVAILLVAPPGRCPRCSATILGWRTGCLECGLGLHAADGARAAETTATMTPPAAQRPERAAARPVRGLPPPVARSRARRGDLYVVRSSPEAPAEPQSMPERVGAIRAMPESLARHRAPDGSGELLATGVFLTGSSELLAGSRYELLVRGDDLLVRGPVDETPDRIRIAHPIDDLEATAVQDDLLISSPAGRSPQLVLGFRALRGRSPEELELLFTHGADPATAAADDERSPDRPTREQTQAGGDEPEPVSDPDRAPVRRRAGARAGRSRASRSVPPPSENGPDRASA